jgi:hypothetical protein
MRISTGWATEFARQKFGVEVDDENDLPALLNEIGGPDGEYALRVLPGLTTAQKYRILKLEAEILSLQAAADFGLEREGSPGYQRLQGLRAERQGLFAAVRQAFPPQGLPVPQAPAAVAPEGEPDPGSPPQGDG